jgi:hypothetical protein
MIFVLFHFVIFVHKQKMSRTTHDTLRDITDCYQNKHSILAADTGCHSPLSIKNFEKTFTKSAKRPHARGWFSETLKKVNLNTVAQVLG